MSSHPFEVNHYRYDMPGLKAPVKVAQLSDLHYGPFIKQEHVRHWVEATLLEKPDLILLTGDMVDRWGTGGLEPLVAELARLEAALGVWACWGNHDHANAKKLRRLHEALEHAGVRVLCNEGASVHDDLFLAAVDDYRKGKPDLEAALKARPPEGACLLMSHNPDVLPHVPQVVDLVLCGHTHGGQLNFPLVGPLRTSSRYGRRFLAGWMNPPDSPVPAYVSRGLGVTLLPVRLNSPAELVMLTLLPI